MLPVIIQDDPLTSLMNQEKTQGTSQVCALMSQLSLKGSRFWFKKEFQYLYCKSIQPVNSLVFIKLLCAQT
jgi:hypothetical protein